MEFLDHVVFPGLFMAPTISEAFGDRHAVLRSILAPDRMAALIAWMLVVRVGDLVKDGAISAVTRVFDALWRRRLRRSSILDKIANANRMLSKRSRPLSRRD
jgi:hypothetical protein